MNVVNPDTGETVNVEQIEDGEIYRCEKGKLKLVKREEDEGMRRIRVTEEAFEAIQEVSRAIRRETGGYRPDITLVASALLFSGVPSMGVQRAVEFVQEYGFRMLERIPKREQPDRSENAQPFEQR